eukprot:2237604-Prymnesium_polylepis.1
MSDSFLAAASARENGITGRSDIKESRDLESLTALHAEGVLDEQEYAEAKARLLAAQRDKLLEEAGVPELERSQWTWSNDGNRDVAIKLAAIQYVDLAQEVCASGMLALDHVVETMGAVSTTAATQQAQGCSGLSILAEKAGTRAEVLAKGAVDCVAGAMGAHGGDAL